MTIYDVRAHHTYSFNFADVNVERTLGADIDDYGSPAIFLNPNATYYEIKNGMFSKPKTARRFGKIFLVSDYTARDIYSTIYFGDLNARNIGFKRLTFRDYANYCSYVGVLAKEIPLALPKNIQKIPAVKKEIERLCLKTFIYQNPFINSNKDFVGTFYWNDGEKAWKYYEREEMADTGLCDASNKTVNSYLKFLDDNEDDDFPKFGPEDFDD